MATAPIVAVDNGKGGSQLKLFMELEGKQHAVFKPKWYDRDKILEGLPYTGLDRHNGEIAAFHLSRVLGMRKTPLAVGRKVSFNRDIIAKASKELAETFFEQDGKVCFYGKCRYCNKENAKCVEDDTMEGAVILWLPSTISIGIDPHPWRRTYRQHVVAKWERDNNYCNNVVRKSEKFITDSALLLDLIDTSVFDYLIGNADRHHYEFVTGQPQGMVLLMDNGKSFGNPNVDERSILAPLYQCCSVRFTTWKKLQALHNSVLSSIMRKVMRADPIAPILTRQHLEALDRRLEKVLQEIENCIEVNGLQAVILETKADAFKENDL